MTQIAEEDPRTAYDVFTAGLIADFRAHDGTFTEGPMAGRRILLLTTTGARSGQSRTCPLVYSRDGDDIIIVASKGGAPTHPAWYANLRAHPEVTVEIGAETFQADSIAIAGGPERDRLYAHHAEGEPSFLDYPTRTDRVIPVIRLARIR